MNVKTIKFFIQTSCRIFTPLLLPCQTSLGAYPPSKLQHIHAQYIKCWFILSTNHLGVCSPRKWK